MAAVTLQVIPSFYAEISKNSLFISAKIYEKHIVSKEYSIAHNDAEKSFVLNCKYHILLLVENRVATEIGPIVFHISTR